MSLGASGHLESPRISYLTAHVIDSNLFGSGVGALCAPLIATPFTGYPTRWRLYYLVSLGLASISLVIVGVVFRGKREHDLLPDLIEVAATDEHAPATPINSNADTLKKMNQIMRVKAVHMLALWAFIYVGLEVGRLRRRQFLIPDADCR